jgi:long-chain fatty acid transport protein
VRNLGAWSLGVVLVLAQPARADFFNGRNVLIGERATLLAGAFTALSDDASAGYYNPAGLVQAPGFTVSASADVYAFYVLSRTEQVNDAGDRLPLSFVRTVILPSTFALSYRVHPRVTVAAHVFSPDRFRLSAINSIDAAVVARGLGDQPYGGLSRSARFDQQSTLYGASAGFAVAEWFSFGASLHYHLAQTSQALASTYFTRPSADGTVPGDQATLLADNEVTSGGLIPQVGVLFRLPAGFRVGASWQCETLMLHSQNSWATTLSTSTQGQLFDSGTVRGDTRYPHRFALGLAWQSPALTLSLDLIAYAPLDYDAPHEVFRTEYPDNRHREDAHFDASLGAEITLSDTFVLRGGLFTNTSSASTQFAEERINLYGGVVGLGVRKDGLETGFGLLGQFGRSAFQRENELGFYTQWTRAQVMFVMGGSHRFFEK